MFNVLWFDSVRLRGMNEIHANFTESKRPTIDFDYIRQSSDVFRWTFQTLTQYESFDAIDFDEKERQTNYERY